MNDGIQEQCKQYAVDVENYERVGDRSGNKSFPHLFPCHTAVEPITRVLRDQVFQLEIISVPWTSLQAPI